MFTSGFYFWPIFNKDATTIKQNTTQHDNIWHIIKNCHKYTGSSVLLSLYLCETPLFKTKPFQLSEFLVVQKEIFSRIMRSPVPVCHFTIFCLFLESLFFQQELMLSIAVTPGGIETLNIH